jgi:hypothetical protein
MLKAAGRTASGRPLIVLGLTGENMARLMAGEPMLVHAHTLGKGFPELTAVIVGGKTVDAIRADVEQHLVGTLVDQLDEARPDRTAAYVAARIWAAKRGRETPKDGMIDAALDAAYGPSPNPPQPAGPRPGTPGPTQPTEPRPWTPGAGWERIKREMPHLIPPEISDDDLRRVDEILAAGRAADLRRAEAPSPGDDGRAG